jgi:hypothetical protein
LQKRVCPNVSWFKRGSRRLTYGHGFAKSKALEQAAL